MIGTIQYINMLHFWKQFLIEGDELYNYLINNLDDMFDGDKIKHFDIRCQYNSLFNSQELRNEYKLYITDIEYTLIHWIKKEKDNNRLFDRELWKPFRDTYTLNDMYNGYRYLFQYKHFYFQLIMETCCIEHFIIEQCKYCNKDNEDDDTPHFKLTLFSFEELYHNMMPEIQWNRQ